MSFAKFEASLFCGRCAVALRMLLWFGCCQILLKHRSSQSVSCTEKAVSDDFSIPETLRLSMTFLIMYRFLSVFLTSLKALAYWSLLVASSERHMTETNWSTETSLDWAVLYRLGFRRCHSQYTCSWLALSNPSARAGVCQGHFKVISYHSLGETLGTFGKQKISCWLTGQDQIEVSDCRECSLAPIPAFRTNQWYKNHQKPNHSIS